MSEHGDRTVRQSGRVAVGAVLLVGLLGILAAMFAPVEVLLAPSMPTPSRSIASGSSGMLPDGRQGIIVVPGDGRTPTAQAKIVTVEVRCPLFADAGDLTGCTRPNGSPLIATRGEPSDSPDRHGREWSIRVIENCGSGMVGRMTACALR